jgi:alpha-L-fucosidase
MTTRREFLGITAASTASAAAAANWALSPSKAGELLQPPAPDAPRDGALPTDPPAPYRQDRPLLDLQRSFLELRFGMFLHFNMATFQDREWGDPAGSTEAFDPGALDTNSWADAAVGAGMRYGCLTTKHHDGFCLWPTASGGDSVLKTPRKIDVVKAYADSFRSRGLSVGLYYSILDLRGDIRHHNVTPEKIARIKLELTELLSGYGPINVLIFDGWDAPWSRITYDEVPFHEIYALVKRLQPNCLISELNASQYPASALYYTDIKAFEQNAGQALPAESLIPSQSCVTLTDGWFWKTGDEGRPLKAAGEVVEKWLRPQNRRRCNLICNAAPGRDGRLAPNILARLKEIGDLVRAAPPEPLPPLAPSHVITTPNLATGRPIRAIDSPDTMGPDLINDGNFRNSWYLLPPRTEGWIEVDLRRPAATGAGSVVSFNTLVFAEPIGRWKDYPATRIARYRFEAWDGAAWRELASGEEADPVRIRTIPRTGAAKVRLTIWRTGAEPHLTEIGVYDEPGRAQA